MKLKLILCALLWLSVVFGQQQQQTQLQLVSPAPAPVASVSATYAGGVFSGNPGTIYYWVIARYPSGTAFPAGPAIAYNTPGFGNLSASNYVTVSWLPVTGATGYDVVTSRDSSFPVNPSCSSCAVVLNTTATFVNDTGAAGSAYPVAGVPAATSATATFTLDNVSEANPFVKMQVFSNIFRLAPLSGSYTIGNCVQLASGGVLADSGGPCGTSANGVTTTATLTSGLPVVGNGAKTVDVGTKQGTGTKFQMAGTNNGALGATLCNDASGNATTSGCSGGSTAFSAITGGTNTTAAMVLGTGGSLDTSGGGFINANRIISTAITSLYGNSGKLPQATGTFTNGNVTGTDASGNIVDGAVAISALVTLTGSQTLTNKVLTTPTIASFVNANHNHSNAAGGGQLSNTAVAAANQQGNGTKFQMAGTNSGTLGDALCNDANGNATTSGCTSGGATVGGLYVTYSGTTYGPVFPVTKPSLSTFSWVNQGGAVETATGSGAFNVVSPATAGNNARMRVTTPPATPYSVTAGILIGTTTNDFAGCGLEVYNSGNSRLLSIQAVSVSSNRIMAIVRWTSPTAATTTVLSQANWYNVFGAIAWFRITNDGTNLNVSASPDGQNFTQLYTETIAAWVGAVTNVGWFVESNNTNFQASCTLFHYQVQ